MARGVSFQGYQRHGKPFDKLSVNSASPCHARNQRSRFAGLSLAIVCKESGTRLKGSMTQRYFKYFSCNESICPFSNMTKVEEACLMFTIKHISQTIEVG